MNKQALSPIIRLSVGLTLMTVSLLLIADLLGFVPNEHVSTFKARTSISESLAVQVSSDIIKEDIEEASVLMHTLALHDASILSIGLRTKGNTLIASTGEHSNRWQLTASDASTINQIQVPIHNRAGRWGTLEVNFKPLGTNTYILGRVGSIFSFIFFVAFVGFFAYWLFLKRALNELDPSAVIPERVSTALNVLAEGLAILDTRGRIVFVNTAFEDKLGQSAKMLVGTNLSELNWALSAETDNDQAIILPWQKLLNGESAETAHLKLRTSLNESFSFTVNIAPIKASDEKIRGVVVTLDDITQLENKNIDLERALGQIKRSQREITRQNQKLQILATRDPMTGLLNRRSLFDGLAILLNGVEDHDEQLSCIMVDIDHFKRVNDSFGHATGDVVIKLLAQILTETARSDDLVSRYGGEEYCVVLPGVSEQLAVDIAERMRLVINKVRRDETTGAIPFTASFGVASISGGKFSAEYIIDLADKALYHAKELGRNRVIPWSSIADLDKPSKPNKELLSKPLPVNNITGVLSDSDNNAALTEQQLHQRVAELEAYIYTKKAHEILSSDDAIDLPDQILLRDRIQQGVDRSEQKNSIFAVLCIDIDPLSEINTSLEKDAANQLAKFLTGRLRTIIQSFDSVVPEGESNIGTNVLRTNNGEFVVLLMDMHEQESVTWIIERLFTKMTESVKLGGTDVFLDARMGVSVYPTDGKSPERLLENANSALQKAKSMLGKDICVYYCNEVNEKAKSQLKMKGELFSAIERNELFIEYQPVISLLSGRINSFEALLRWRHPEFGLVNPEVFISIAEHAGLIESIGNWVLDKACRQLKAWHNLGHEGLTIAVNFSAVQFKNLNFANNVLDIIKKAGLIPADLTMEITESTLIQNLDKTRLTINELSTAGVCISLDDFGTGYSSLSYMKLFPIDIVKIDKSFLRDFPDHGHDNAMVSAIIAMVHSLGLHVVAEGVEEKGQLQALQNLGCDSIQGYFFSKPISRKGASELIVNPADIRRIVWDTRRSDSAIDNPVLAGVLNNAPKHEIRYAILDEVL